jgi:hypothetical protein
MLISELRGAGQNSNHLHLQSVMGKSAILFIQSKAIVRSVVLISSLTALHEPSARESAELAFAWCVC